MQTDHERVFQGDCCSRNRPLQGAYFLIKKNKILNNGIYILSVETQYLCPTHNHSSNSKTLGQLYSEVSFNFKKLIDFKGVLLVLRS